MRRIYERDSEGRRSEVWSKHTQGSGKSLTMVFWRTIALRPDIPNHKIVLVTDRVDLDDQIYKTFHACGKEVEQARTGKDLAEMLRENKQRIITTVIDKFDAAVGRQNARNDNPNILCWWMKVIVLNTAPCTPVCARRSRGLLHRIYRYAGDEKRSRY